MNRSARYGLRGVRVGEAKHPGPPRAHTSTDQPETGIVEALEFDLTNADSGDDAMQGTIVDGSDESSTESVVRRPRRRLCLTWHEETDLIWHRDARAAEGVVRNLASRIGAVPEGEIPAPVRRQRWSPLNVPLIWSAAGHDDSSPVLDWLAGSLTGAPRLAFHDGAIDAPDAVRNGWSALRTVFRMWSIHEREDLTGWLRRHRFPWHPTRKSHLSQGTGAHFDGGLQDRCKGCVVKGQLRGGCVARRQADGSSQGNPRRYRATASPGRAPGGTDESFGWCLGAVGFGRLPRFVPHQDPNVEELSTISAREVARESVLRSEREVQRQDGGRCTGRNTWLEVVR